jgi:hypothetical protein
MRHPDAAAVSHIHNISHIESFRMLLVFVLSTLLLAVLLLLLEAKGIQS